MYRFGIQPDYITDPRARVIYETQVALYKAGKEIDLVETLRALNTGKQLNDAGGKEYVLSLAERGTNLEPIYLPEKVKIVRGAYIKTRRTVLLQKLLTAADAGDFDTMDRVKQQLKDLDRLDRPTPIFKRLDFGAVMALPPKQWLIENIIGVGDMAMVFGEPGAGKTFVTVDLLFSAITGNPFARDFATPRPLTVAYCTDEGTGGIKSRFEAAAHWHNLNNRPGARERLSVFLDVPQLFDRSAEKYMRRFCDDWQAGDGGMLDLLVIDTLNNAAIGSRENDSGDASQIIAAAKIARDELGCAVLVIHHANRAGTGYRGSSAYEAAMDVMLEVTGNKHNRKLKSFKMKDASRFDDRAFHLEPYGESVYVVWDGIAADRLNNADALLAEMQSMPGERLTAKQWGDAVGITQKAALSAFASLHKFGKVQRELQSPNADKSSRNPWVFWIE